MSSLLARLSAAGLALLLTACASFTNGIADKPAANDDRLIGIWDVAGEGAPPGAVSIAAKGPASLSVTVYEDDRCEKATHLTALRTRIGQRDFLDLIKSDSDASAPRHAPLAYQFQGPNKLAAFPADDEVIASAIETKELAGTITTYPQANLPASIEVTASSAELRKWIAAHPEAMRRNALTLVRSDPAKVPHCG